MRRKPRAVLYVASYLLLDGAGVCAYCGSRAEYAVSTGADPERAYVCAEHMRTQLETAAIGIPTPPSTAPVSALRQ